jgi:tetratricopeptide (TPR) repeat protein
MNKYLVFSLFILIIVWGCIQFDGVRKNLTDAEDMLDLREYESALEYLNNAAKIEPDNPEIKAKIASIYQRMEKNDEAIALFKQIIKEHPDYYEAYQGLWSTLIAVNQNKQSKTDSNNQLKKQIEALLNKSKPSDKLYSAVFLTLMELEDYERAGQIKKLLMEQYPNSPQIEDVGQESFENILKAGSELKKRAPLAETFIKEFPNHIMTDMAYRIALSYYWKEAKDKEKVKELCSQWIKTHPDDSYAFCLSSRLYSEMEIDLSQSIIWAKECIRLIKSDITEKPFWHNEWQYRDSVRLYDGYDVLGWAYYKTKNYKKAEEYLQRGIRLFDFHSRLWHHLGKVYQTTDKHEEALHAFIKSLISRNDIPELKDDLKDVITKIFPRKDKETLDDFINNLYRGFAEKEGISYFVDITEESGLGKAKGRCFAWGDYDNDGYQDLLINGCKLWRNNGNGTFTDVTKETGNISDGFSTEAAAWGDYNRDGFVDIYVANYEKHGSQLANGIPDILWKNIKGKLFKDVSREAGIVSLEQMCGRGVSWADYNNDGWLDIFVANYRLDPNFLWKNNGDGAFTNVARKTGAEGTGKKGYFGHTIGGDWADYNNDGNLDLFTANLAHPRYITFSNMSYLLQNQGPPDYKLVDFRQPAGIRYEETHSNPAWCDYDNDGLLDLYITSVYDGPPSFLYKQDKSNRFIDVTWVTGTRITDGWGCAWADFDNDGDMDLIVNGRDKNGPRIFLFRNETIKLMPKRNWLEVKLVGKDCNRSAIGARITVQEDPLQLMREVQGGTGTACQNSLVQHFGLGDSKESIFISVRWPCGKIQTLVAQPKQIITIQENP